MKYKLIMNLEKDYRLEVINNNGFIKDKYDLTQEEMKDIINDMTEQCTDNNEDKDKLLDTLREAYSLFNLKSISINKD